jgi:hypothetical protein
MTFQEGAMQGSRDRGETAVSPWAITFLILAAVLMMVVGVFHIIEGLAAVINDQFFVVVNGYAYDMDVSTWGWIHLIGGIIVAISGFMLFTGALWARIVAVIVVIGSAILNFVTIPYCPVWSIIMLAVNGGVLWALIAHGRDLSENP